jgi:hypothetical protein
LGKEVFGFLNYLCGFSDQYPNLVDVAISVVEATSTRRADDGEDGNDAEYADPFCKLSNLQSEEESVLDVNIKGIVDALRLKKSQIR